jgi:hypothetical protein
MPVRLSIALLSLTRRLSCAVDLPFLDFTELVQALLVTALLTAAASRRHVAAAAGGAAVLLLSLL